MISLVKDYFGRIQHGFVVKIQIMCTLIINQVIIFYVRGGRGGGGGGGSGEWGKHFH